MPWFNSGVVPSRLVCQSPGKNKTKERQRQRQELKAAVGQWWPKFETRFRFSFGALFEHGDITGSAACSNTEICALPWGGGAVLQS